MALPRALISWSSGKDSAWALHEARQANEVEIVGILTTVTESFRRVSMHGVREELLDAQARALRLPLLKVPIPYPCTNATYEEAMGAALAQAKGIGVTKIVFGDLFLRDIRKYRESKLAGTSFEGVWPLWGQDTRELAHRMINAGLRATVVCLDPKRVPRELAGRQFDRDLLRGLPAGVDPCAENGEFHTFAWDGPMFAQPIAVRSGETIERDGFVFADLLPA